MVSVEGENMRQVTWVVIDEVKSGDWGIGGKGLTTQDVKELAAGYPDEVVVQSTANQTPSRVAVREGVLLFPAGHGLASIWWCARRDSNSRPPGS